MSQVTTKSTVTLREVSEENLFSILRLGVSEAQETVCRFKHGIHSPSIFCARAGLVPCYLRGRDAGRVFDA